MNENRSRFSKKISGRTQGNGMFKWFMLFVYILLCSYVFTGWFRWRKWMGIPHWKIVSIGIAFLLLLLASSIFLGKFLPQSEIQLKILQFGNYWIGFLIYVIFFILVCDLIWLLRSLLAFIYIEDCLESASHNSYFLFGAKLNYESCMAKPKPTQNGED